MSDMNLVVLQGHIVKTEHRQPTPTFGLFEIFMSVATPNGNTESIKVTMKNPNEHKMKEIDNHRYVVIDGAKLSSRQDKNDPNKWYYSLDCQQSSVNALPKPPSEDWDQSINQGFVQGIIRQVNSNILIVEARYNYMDSRTKSWTQGQNFIHVVAQQEMSPQLEGHMAIFKGYVTPKLGDAWTPNLVMESMSIHGGVE